MHTDENLIMQTLLIGIIFYVAVCSPECSNSGTCTAPNTCNCTAEWTGSTCDTGNNYIHALHEFGYADMDYTHIT